jgi:hypothetical protein
MEESPPADSDLDVPNVAPVPAAALPIETAAPDDMRARVLVTACVDFRFADPLVDWLRAQGLQGQYDLRTHESASFAVDHWLPSAVAINTLHDVEAIWIVDHDDCGAYRLAGEPNTRENHVHHLKVAQARVQAWIGKPVRIFFHPLGPNGRGAPTIEEIK